MAETVLIKLESDSGPYAAYYEVASSHRQEHGASVVSVSRDLWSRYEAAQSLLNELEQQIEKSVIVWSCGQ